MSSRSYEKRVAPKAKVNIYSWIFLFGYREQLYLSKVDTCKTVLGSIEEDFDAPDDVANLCACGHNLQIFLY